MDGWSFSMLIPVAAIVWAIADTWGKHLRKMKEMDMKMMKKGGDISAELQSAIKSEFERMRNENAELRKRVEILELGRRSNLLTDTQVELAKQVKVQQPGM